MKKPVFFIVGAPKCGTRSLYLYLKQHPAVFLPSMKEPHHFADDLLRPDDPLLNRANYLSLFNDAEDGQLIGEASVFYLYSDHAAKNIKEFCSEAKAIIMLRNPVDVIYSLHSQLVFNGEEDIKDFEEALQAEEERKQGLRMPARTRFVKKHFYRDVPKYADQLRRFFDALGRENVHVIIYDDFKRNTRESFLSVCSFLGIEAIDSLDFRVFNANKKVRFKALQDIINNPPSLLRQAGKMLTPRFLRRWGIDYLKAANTRFVLRPPLPETLKTKLTGEYEKEIYSVSVLLGRDLTTWGKY